MILIKNGQGELFIEKLAGNSYTNHQAIIDFKGKGYFIYHNGALAANA